MPMRYKHHEKQKLAWYERGPGPAYLLPPLVGKKDHALTHRINPAYVLGLKLDQGLCPNGCIGPGPAAYMVERGWKADGRFLGYFYSIGEKLPHPLYNQEVVGPPANKYDLPMTDLWRPRQPAWPFGLKPPLYMKKVSPGPCYMLPTAIGPKIPDKLAAAECTLKGDKKIKDPGADAPYSPGPIYDVGPPDVILKRAPKYTLRRKWKDLTLDEYEASPASYDAVLPKCPCSVPKGWHLGIRYNDFTGIFRTPCDKPRFEALD